MDATDYTSGDDLGALLSRLLSVVVEREAPILQARGLTMWEYVILSQLVEEDALTQNDLADRSRRDPTRLIGHLDTLADRRLISRQTDASDRRRRTVRLTDKGRDLVHAVRRDIRAMEADLLAGLAQDAQRDLRTSLAAVLRGAKAGCTAQDPAAP